MIISIRIVIADERKLISEAIAGFLESIQDFDVVLTVNQREDLIPGVLRMRPSVAVLGMAMDGLDQLHMAEELRAVAPYCAVTVIATEPTHAMMARALSAGVFGVVPNNGGLAHLVHAIRGASAGCATIDPTLFHKPVQVGRSLSDREQSVLRLTVTGAPIREIAAELFLSPGTVRNLTSSAIKKLNGRNRFDAARIAVQQGWI